MEQLNFTNLYYKNLALNSNQISESNHTPTEALFLLLNGVELEDLSNLCILIQNYYKSLPLPINLSIEDCYKLTQNIDTINIQATKSTMKIIEKLVFKCLNKGINLGNRTISDGKINTSSWINHSLYAGECCAVLADKLGLDSDTAKVLGILHDYGRKFNHSFCHVIYGYEKLVDLGWNNEAIACLTHSFVNNGRCANNDAAITGFFVNNEGNPNWKEETIKDDVTLFLENYKYTPYDVVLNIADLMATSKGIVSPQERIADIATRRHLDPTNRTYFLAETINMLNDYLRAIGTIKHDIKKVKATKNISIEDMNSLLNSTSTLFFISYKQMIKEREQNSITKNSKRLS